MAAALGAARSGGSEVCLFEKNQRCGRKLLLSGSGQCNITHTGTIDEFLHSFPSDQRAFLKPLFRTFFREELFALFAHCGIRFRVREDGKYFPESRRAAEVLNCLEKQLFLCGVVISCGCAVTAVIPDSGTYTLKTGDGSCVEGWDAVILTGGGQSFPATGSDGSAFGLAAALGHTIEATRPALSDITVNDFFLSDCMGISFENAAAVLWRDGKIVMDLSGDLLITHRGFSGPLMLNNSRYFRAGDELRIDFRSLSGRFEQDFISYADRSGSRILKSFLSSCGFPGRFVSAVLSENGISTSLKIAEIGKKQRSRLKQLFSAASFIIDSTGDYKSAMLTAGGVALSEVRKGTLESIIHKGLYFAGEVLDIDGPTGGYNLQAAFSGGYCAGKGAAG